MACSACQKRAAKFVPVYKPRNKFKQNDKCVFDLEYLETLLKSDKLSDIDKSFVLSQINVYNKNCNLFHSYIENAVQKLNS